MEFLAEEGDEHPLEALQGPVRVEESVGQELPEPTLQQS